MHHPYFSTPAMEQHSEAKDRYKVEAMAFLSSQKPVITGRVLEVNTGLNQ